MIKTLFLTSLLFCVGASGAEVTGQVTDPTGAVVEHARITVVNARGTKLLAAETNESGRFAFNGLSPGKYSVHVESGAFDTAAVDVEVVEGTPTPSLSKIGRAHV